MSSAARSCTPSWRRIGFIAAALSWYAGRPGRYAGQVTGRRKPDAVAVAVGDGLSVAPFGREGWVAALVAGTVGRAGGVEAFGGDAGEDRTGRGGRGHDRPLDGSKRAAAEEDAGRWGLDQCDEGGRR